MRLVESISTRMYSYYSVLHLCAISEDKMLLACGFEGLRALSLLPSPTELSARRRATIRERVVRVSNDPHTDTLLSSFKHRVLVSIRLCWIRV